VLSADVSSCARALLPLAREVLSLVQGLLRPEGTAAAAAAGGSSAAAGGQQGVSASTAAAAGEEEGDGRQNAKQAAQVGGQALWRHVTVVGLRPLWLSSWQCTCPVDFCVAHTLPDSLLCLRIHTA
jgi:hypothetical protein